MQAMLAFDKSTAQQAASVKTQQNGRNRHASCAGLLPLLVLAATRWSAQAWTEHAMCMTHYSAACIQPKQKVNAQSTGPLPTW